MSSAREAPRAARLVTVALTPDACLAVLARDGRAELGRAGILRGDARLLAERFGAAGDEAELAAWLLARGAPDASAAQADARRFLEELARLGPDAERAGASDRPGEHPRPAARERERDGGDAPDPAAERWTELARAVLAGGARFRFRARGRSMRPFLPHGTALEVAPCAFGAVRRGEIVLHASAHAPLVAHRVLGRRSDALVTRGDSNARTELVPARDFLGVVVARERAGDWRPLTGHAMRAAGLLTNHAYAAAVGLARLAVLRPLRATFRGRSFLRATLRALLRGTSGALFLAERAAVRARRPLDVLRAALLSSTEKDGERTGLYRRRAIQDFTAQDENVRAGLTLLEEVLLARHPLTSGRVLVLGCGPGREALVLARRGCSVSGLDREPGMLARARELAREQGLAIDYHEGEAEDFELAGGPLDAVVVFSGLLNMLLPRARRVRMLACCRRHLVPGGRVFVTFLAAYRRADADDSPSGKPFLAAMNPEHEPGDLYLLNEAIHVFPRDEDVAAEAAQAGLTTVEIFRDQRAYDRPAGQVRGYAVLRRPE